MTTTDEIRDTEAHTIGALATAAAEPQPLDDEGRFFSVVVPEGGSQKTVDLEALREATLANPRRKVGSYRVHDADSFAAYFAKHASVDSEIWADTTEHKLVAVLDAHAATAEGLAGHEDHRLSYAVQTTDAWKAWTELDNQLMNQAAFAEHIENRRIDIVAPSSADMLELAQSFQATIGVQFQSSKRLQSGERQLEYKEQVDATAGRSGQLEIPETFTLRLIPFEGASVFDVVARFRYRITNGQLAIGYQLERPEDVIREAFETVIAAVASKTETTIYRGVTA